MTRPDDSFERRFALEMAVKWRAAAGSSSTTMEMAEIFLKFLKAES